MCSELRGDKGTFGWASFQEVVRRVAGNFLINLPHEGIKKQDGGRIDSWLWWLESEGYCLDRTSALVFLDPG